VQTVVNVALAIVLVVLLLVQVRPRRNVYVPVLAAGLVIAAAAVAVPARWKALFKIGGEAARRWFVIESGACAAVVAVFVAVYAASNEDRRSPRPFARALAAYLGRDAPQQSRPALYRAGLPPTVAFYLPVDTGREETARTVIVVGGKNARAPEVAARYAAESGQTVAGAREVELDVPSNPERWTVIELTLENPRRLAAVGTRGTHFVQRSAGPGSFRTRSHATSPMTAAAAAARPATTSTGW
jgi:hypothetical protein